MSNQLDECIKWRAGFVEWMESPDEYFGTKTRVLKGPMLAVLRGVEDRANEVLRLVNEAESRPLNLEIFRLRPALPWEQWSDALNAEGGRVASDMERLVQKVKNAEEGLLSGRLTPESVWLSVKGGGNALGWICQPAIALGQLEVLTELWQEAYGEEMLKLVGVELEQASKALAETAGKAVTKAVKTDVGKVLIGAGALAALLYYLAKRK